MLRVKPIKEILPSPFELLLLFVAVADLVVLMADLLQDIWDPVSQLLHKFDVVACGIFFVDFVMRLARSPNKRAFLRWGWIDLVACIPQVALPRFGILIRALRLVRVIRIVQSTRMLTTHLWAYRSQHVLAAITTLSLLITAFASVAILQFEHVDGGNIRTPGDALWWALTTVTTVGYGDRYPVTTEGRVVAAMLMIVGVGLFGTFTAFVSRLFIASEVRDENEELTKIHDDLNALRDELRVFRSELSAREAEERNQKTLQK